LLPILPHIVPEAGSRSGRQIGVRDHLVIWGFRDSNSAA
jgi:hypothetical protein